MEKVSVILNILRLAITKDLRYLETEEKQMRFMSVRYD